MKRLFLIFILFIFLVGCKSFEPVIIPGQPDECNDFYSVLQYYSVNGHDSAFVGTVYEKCSQARKDKDKAEIKRLNEKLTSACEKANPENLEEFKRCIK